MARLNAFPSGHAGVLCTSILALAVVEALPLFEKTCYMFTTVREDKGHMQERPQRASERGRERVRHVQPRHVVELVLEPAEEDGQRRKNACHMGMGQNQTSRGPQVLVHISFYHGSIIVPIFDPQPHLKLGRSLLV